MYAYVVNINGPTVAMWALCCWVSEHYRLHGCEYDLIILWMIGSWVRTQFSGYNNNGRPRTTHYKIICLSNLVLLMWWQNPKFIRQYIHYTYMYICFYIRHEEDPFRIWQCEFRKIILIFGSIEWSVRIRATDVMKTNGFWLLLRVNGKLKIFKKTISWLTSTNHQNDSTENM